LAASPYAGIAPLAGQIKTVRIVKRAGKWYAAFSCITEAQPLERTEREVGIDVGVASLLTKSDGEKVDNPRWYRIEQRTLRVLQRRVARRKKGGRNRNKAILALQRQHERIGNRRKDFLNKLAHGLITGYDRIALEDLRIKNMVRNPHLARVFWMPDGATYCNILRARLQVPAVWCAW
jgi:putative transposase